MNKEKKKTCQNEYINLNCNQKVKHTYE